MNQNPFDPLDTQAQEQRASDGREQAKLAFDLEAADFKWLMGNKRGRRIVWRLLERTGVFRSSFTGNSTTFFNEGQRNVGLMLMAQIHEHSPDAYALMLNERKAAQ